MGIQRVCWPGPIRLWKRPRARRRCRETIPFAVTEHEAPTREKALQQLRILILERLAKAELVTLEIQPTEIGHSWAPFAGDWANNPSMEEFRAEIEQHRRE